MSPKASIGIVTGSGGHNLPGMAVIEEYSSKTRFGPAMLRTCRLGSTDVIQVSRHAAGHQRLSNHVDQRSYISALAEVGVTAILSTTVCGSLDPSLAPGSLIVFDDLYFPSNRLADGSLCTIFDEPGHPGQGHLVFDSPFSSDVREALIAAAGPEVVTSGCYGHVDGPRFNSKTEIATLAGAGVTAVSQTAGPEPILCGELGLAYGLIGFVTDYANGVAATATTPDELLENLRSSTAALSQVLIGAISILAGRFPTPAGRIVGI
jgi:purine nucleoside phosphorylase